MRVNIQGSSPTIKKFDSVVFFLISTALYFFTRSISLDEFDALNLAFGLREFNLTLHQPHPPGAPLFIFFGKILFSLGLSEKDSLELLAAIGGGFLVGACHYLINTLYGRSTAFWYALILMLLPGLWMTSGKAMTDSLANGLMMMSAVFLITTLNKPENSYRNCLIATVIAAVSIGVRPPLAPLVIVMLFGSLMLRAEWRTYRDMVAVFTVVSLVWLIPTILTQANLEGNNHGLLNYLEQLKSFREESAGIASWHFDFSQFSLHYLVKRLVMHLGGVFYFGMGFSVWYPEAANQYLANLATARTPWNASISEWSWGGTVFFLLCSYGWILMVLKLRRVIALRRIEVVSVVWFFIVFIFLFLTVPPLMRYYLPLYPLLLAPVVVFIFRQKHAKFVLSAMVLSLLSSVLPLAIEQATEYSPSIRFIEEVRRYQKENNIDSSNVRLLVNGNVQRHLDWYAADLKLINLDKVDEEWWVDEDWWGRPHEVVVLSNLQADQVSHSGLFNFTPIAEHARSLRVWMRNNSANLYLIERKSGQVLGQLP